MKTIETRTATYAQLADEVASEGSLSVRYARLTSEDITVWRRLMSRALRGKKIPYRSFVGAGWITFEKRGHHDEHNCLNDPTTRLGLQRMDLAFDMDMDPMERARRDRELAQRQERLIWFALIPLQEEGAPAATKGVGSSEEVNETRDAIVVQLQPKG